MSQPVEKLCGGGEAEHAPSSKQPLCAKQSVGTTVKSASYFKHSDPQILRLHDPECRGCLNVYGFSPDGGLVATSTEDSRLLLWDTASGKVAHKLRGHCTANSYNFITVASFGCQGRVLATGDNTGKMAVWCMGQCAKRQWQLSGHSAAIRSLCFTQKRSLYSCSDDGTIREWSQNCGQSRLVCKADNRTATKIACSPNGVWVAVAKEPAIVAWRADTNRCIALSGHKGAVKDIAFSPDSKMLVSGGADRTVRVWDLTKGVCIAEFNGHTGDIAVVRFAPDCDTVVSASFDTSIRLWSIQQQKWVGSCGFQTPMDMPVHDLHVSEKCIRACFYHGYVYTWGGLSLHTSLLPIALGTTARAGHDSSVRNSFVSNPLYDRCLWKIIADFTRYTDENMRKPLPPVSAPPTPIAGPNKESPASSPASAVSGEHGVPSGVPPVASAPPPSNVLVSTS